mgnify:CR=1 FL=1
MINFYAQQRWPSFEQRVEDVAEAITGPDRNLKSFPSIVSRAVYQTQPYSLTGWNTLGVCVATEAVRRELDTYKEGLREKAVTATLALICVVRIQRSFRARVWREGGELYKNLSKTTMVGRSVEMVLG